uniref:Uncharacterized protein n=1 Tax=Oryza barthii TaxID=65489 RepID=A0A0D3GBD5_9ORYZ
MELAKSLIRSTLAGCSFPRGAARRSASRCSCRVNGGSGDDVGPFLSSRSWDSSHLSSFHAMSIRAASSRVARNVSPSLSRKSFGSSSASRRRASSSGSEPVTSPTFSTASTTTETHQRRLWRWCSTHSVPCVAAAARARDGAEGEGVGVGEEGALARVDAAEVVVEGHEGVDAADGLADLPELLHPPPPPPRFFFFYLSMDMDINLPCFSL